MAGKCPKCDAYLTGVTVDGIKINGSDGRTWNGVNYSCPICSTIISVEMDPLLLKNDIVNELFNKLRK